MALRTPSQNYVDKTVQLSRARSKCAPPIRSVGACRLYPSNLASPDPKSFHCSAIASGLELGSILIGERLVRNVSSIKFAAARTADSSHPATAWTYTPDSKIKISWARSPGSTSLLSCPAWIAADIRRSSVHWRSRRRRSTKSRIASQHGAPDRMARKPVGPLPAAKTAVSTLPATSSLRTSPIWTRRKAVRKKRSRVASKRRKAWRKNDSLGPNVR
jgi:hypothetical protein